MVEGDSFQWFDFPVTFLKDQFNLIKKKKKKYNSRGDFYGPEGESQSLRLTGSFYYFLVYYIVRKISFLEMLLWCNYTSTYCVLWLLAVSSSFILLGLIF